MDWRASSWRRGATWRELGLQVEERGNGHHVALQRGDPGKRCPCPSLLLPSSLLQDSPLPAPHCWLGLTRRWRTGSLWAQGTQVSLQGRRRGHRGAQHIQALSLDSSMAPTLWGFLGRWHEGPSTGHGHSTCTARDTLCHTQRTKDQCWPLLLQVVWVTCSLETRNTGSWGLEPWKRKVAGRGDHPPARVP